jgi:tRNA1Val (adenine37-N6)-methyltransferase
MIDYVQPDFYRFTTDSIWLSDVVASHFKTSHHKINLLDLCSGSGVVGLEIFQKMRNISLLHFVEIQKEFKPYFEKNHELFVKDNSVSVNFFLSDIINYETDQRYDLIVCNPPYFKKGSGKIPKDPQREICRFSEESFEEKLVSKAKSLLAPGGRFYFLTQNNYAEMEFIEKKARTSIFLFEEKVK